MKIHWLIAGLCSVAMTTSFAWAQGAAQDAQLEDFSRQLGPFAIKGQQFNALLHMKRVQAQGPVVDPVFQETLIRMEIKDAVGTVHYEKTFPLPEVSGDSFDETTSAYVEMLQGNQGSGLLISYGWSPSTPRGGASYQVFGLFDNKLVPLSKPVSLEGELINEASGDQVTRTSDEPNLQGEVLNFRIWSGNFFVIFPARVDWLQAKMLPAWRCAKMTARGPQPLCRFRVETDRIPAEEDTTFVRLFPEPEEGFTPAHVVVKKDSKIEFLEVECEVVWDEDENGIGLTVSDDPWLKVRIDGKEGWIHTQEDFQAIGLPQAG